MFFHNRKTGSKAERISLWREKNFVTNLLLSQLSIRQTSGERSGEDEADYLTHATRKKCEKIEVKIPTKIPSEIAKRAIIALRLLRDLNF